MIHVECYRDMGRAEGKEKFEGVQKKILKKDAFNPLLYSLGWKDGDGRLCCDACMSKCPWAGILMPKLLLMCWSAPCMAATAIMYV